MNKKSLPPISFVLGGAGSGKSFFAENLCDLSGLSKVYLATSEVWDDETAAKVSQHKKQRGTGWHTIEEPRVIAGVLLNRHGCEVLLVDCMTLWLTNVILAEADIDSAIKSALDALSACACPVVAVGNEVGQGIVPENALARRFRNDNGKMNQTLAATADLVVHVVAGLPQVLKGALP